MGGLIYGILLQGEEVKAVKWASKEEILRDAEILSLDMNIVNDFVSREDEVSDDEMDDEELFSIINAKRG